MMPGLNVSFAMFGRWKAFSRLSCGMTGNRKVEQGPWGGGPLHHPQEAGGGWLPIARAIGRIWHPKSFGAVVGFEAGSRFVGRLRG